MAVRYPQRPVASRALIRRSAAALALAACLAAAAGCGGDDPGATPATTANTTTSSTTSTTTGGATTLAAAASEAKGQLAGIPQAGLVLGRARAPVTIVEYAGFDCGTCAAVHRTILPELIERYVRPGTASIELRVLVAGDHDLALALGVHAARPQGKAWQMTQLAYLRADADPASAAADETARSYASALGLDLDRWTADVERPRWASDIKAALSVFKVARLTETPVFLVRRIGLESEPFEVVSAPSSIDDLAAAIDAALAR